MINLESLKTFLSYILCIHIYLKSFYMLLCFLENNNEELIIFTWLGDSIPQKNFLLVYGRNFKKKG